ncbi:hypothetical protein PPUJ20066_09790 [Pseudomonas putida]|nr:hypothetical protein PPUJ20066_09790 [Pseudomonas putida]
MIQSSPEEAVVNEYFSNANGPTAFLLLSLGYTSLQFAHPQPFAWGVIIISMMWLFSIGGPYRAIRKYYLPDGAPLRRWIPVVWRLKVFLVAMMFTVAVAVGMTEDSIYFFLGLSTDK